MNGRGFTMRYCVTIFLFLSILLSNVQAQTSWLDSLYVRVADAKVDRPTGGDAVVVFDIEVFRPVSLWNNNDTTLGSSDFVFGKPGMNMRTLFKNVQVNALHSEIDPNRALMLNGRFVLDKLQISLTKTGKGSELKLPYREWVKLCRVSLPLEDPETVKLGLVWDRTSTGLITARNIPILEDLREDLENIPDTILTIDPYSTSRNICSGEEFFLFAHPVSSGTALKGAWHYSVDGGTSFVALDGTKKDWTDAAGGTAFQYYTRGDYADTVWLRGITANLSGIIFKYVAEDPSVSATKRETPHIRLSVWPEVKVALEGYPSLTEFQSNLGLSGDTVRHCPGEKARVRVALYGVENSSQLNNLKRMGALHVAYRWVNKLGGDGRDTLTAKMADVTSQTVNWGSGFVVTSDKLELGLEEDGKYYIHSVWTDSCSAGTVLTAYDTVVVKENSRVSYEFDPIEYVAGSGDVNVESGLGIVFTSSTLKNTATAVGAKLGPNYSAPAGAVGTDTILYQYNADGCTVTATRLIHVVSAKHIAIKVLLEGPYIAKVDSMRCIYEGYFPTIIDKYVSPYADKKEYLKPFPKFDRGIVDWIYVEVWDYPPNGKFFGDTRKGVVVDSVSALLLSDGTVAGLDGNKYVTFDHLANNDYYVQISHRNHLSIMSADPVTFTAGTITAANTIDFTQKIENAYDASRPASKQDPLKMLNGRCMMYGGDLNEDGMINAKDINIQVLVLYSVGYLVGDVSLDSQVNPVDKAILINNSGICRKF